MASLIAVFSFGSAACYVLAALFMKHWDVMGGVPAAFLVAVTLTGAVLFETEALRQARLGYVFIIILGFETCLSLLCAWLLLHEAYALHELLGLGLIILGVAVANLSSAAHGA